MNDYEGLLDQLAQAELLPHDLLAAFVMGSRARGFTHNNSDIDLYVVTGERWGGQCDQEVRVGLDPPSVPAAITAFGDIPLEVRYWQERQVDQLIARLDPELFRDGRAHAGDTWAEISFPIRLQHAVVLAGADWVAERRAQLAASALRLMVVTEALDAMDSATEDAVGMLESGDTGSATIAAKWAFAHAVQALLCAGGDVDEPKWRARRMALVDPPLLRYDEYLAFETMRDYDLAAPEKWINSVLELCQRISMGVEL
ncbi:nucleotidyltransferase domain-containing protein [Micromonospora sp. DT62]|uniref:nucleotidyltransferase domain-containing protein n=1 Tax=Micromonospora sp. DT62 TaxID=3416521 RepID=UPI003CE6A830